MLATLAPALIDVTGDISTGQIFFSEFFGTMVLLLLGVGVCATNNLGKSKGRGTGWLMINFGWGLAVFTGVYVAYATGGHLNPAVTIGKVVAHMMDDSVTLNGPAIGAGGIAVTAGNVAIYILAQFLGAFVGAVLAWMAYKKQFDADADAGAKLGCFATGPESRSYGWNVVTEAIGTFVLVYWVFISGGTQSGLGPLGVALIIVVIGASLGGPTGYAINPARDFAPRLAHQLLPIPGKGKSDWSYAWVPFVGPILGAVIAALLAFAPTVGLA